MKYVVEKIDVPKDLEHKFGVPAGTKFVYYAWAAECT